MLSFRGAIQHKTESKMDQEVCHFKPTFISSDLHSNAMVSTNISISFWQVINVAKYLFPCNAIVSYNIFRINVSVSGKYKNCRSLFFDLTVLQGILCYREFAFTVNVNYYYDFPKESMPVFKKTLGQTKSKFLSQMSRDVSFLSSSAT